MEDDMETPQEGQGSPSLHPDGKVIPVEGTTGAKLLQAVYGLSTGASYRVAAVRGTNAMLVVQYYPYSKSFKVKFYPDMNAWGMCYERLEAIGAHDHLMRDGLYERILLSEEGMAILLERIKTEAAGKTEIETLADRLEATELGDLVAQFT